MDYFLRLCTRLFIGSLLIFITSLWAGAQDGENSADIQASETFWLEPVWSTKVDPRWEPGISSGDVEDGITAEFVEFTADGSRLATSNGQGEAFVLNAEDGSIEHTFTYITEEELSKVTDFDISGGETKGMEVECGAFTPDGRHLVIGGNLNGVKIFNISKDSLVKHIEEKEEVDGLMISPNGSLFAHGSHQSAKVYNAQTWEFITQIDYGSNESNGPVINSIDFTADAGYMVLGGNYGHVQVNRSGDWKIHDDGLIQNPSSIKSVRFSPSDNYIASGYGGGTIAIWRAFDMHLVKKFDLFYIEAVAWSANSNYILAGGRDGHGRLRVYRTSTWQLVGDPEVQADNANIEYIDVHEDLVAIAGEDAHVRLFRIRTSEE